MVYRTLVRARPEIIRTVPSVYKGIAEGDIFAGLNLVIDWVHLHFSSSNEILRIGSGARKMGLKKQKRKATQR
jgi:hypothetical protein